jgi:hypothetical protein
MRTTRRRLVGIGLSAICCLGCPRPELREVDPGGLPSELRPVEGARDADARQQGEMIGVHYGLDLAYPAAAALAEIEAQVPDTWTPRRESFQNPGLSTSHVRGWTQYQDLTTDPDSWVHQWSSEWQNAEGDILAYDLHYRSIGPFASPMGLDAPTNTDLVVTATLLPAAVVRHVRWQTRIVQAFSPAPESRLLPACERTVPAEIVVVRPVSRSASGSRLEPAAVSGGSVYFDPAETLLEARHICADGIEVQGPSTIFLRLTDEGSDRMRTWSRANVGSPIGIFVDGQLSSAPTVQSPIEGFVAVPAADLEAAERLAERLSGSE